MTRPQLIQRFRSSTDTTLAVFKWVNGTVIQIGSNFDSDFTTTEVKQNPSNRAVHWNGNLYAMGNDYFWKYDIAGSGDWAPLLEFSAVATPGHDIGRLGGVLPMDVAGVSTLIFPMTDSSHNLIFLQMDKDENFTAPSPVAPLTTSDFDGDTDSWFSICLFRNQYTWCQGSSAGGIKLYQYSPNANILTGYTFASPLDANTAVDICPFQNQLYILGHESNIWKIFRLEGGAAVALVTLSTITKHSNLGRNEVVLVGDSTSLYSLFRLTGSEIGWEFKQIDIAATGITVADLTPNIPQHIIRNNGIAGVGNSTFLNAYVDIESNPGGQPEINFYYSASAVENSTVNAYKWNGPGNNFEFLGAGGDKFKFAFSHVKVGGGNRAWAGSGELDAFVTMTDVVGSNVEFDYEIHGGTGQQVNIEWYITRENDPPLDLATIISTDNGVLVGQTIISGVVADGNTKHCAWAAVTDGITSVDMPILIPRIITI